MKRDEIIKYFSDIMADVEGICGFVSSYSTDYLLDTLENIHISPISKVQLDQLLSLQRIRGVSDGFFRFYWLSRPNHFYVIEEFNVDGKNSIDSLEHFKWGLNRIFIDCLYVYGNIQMGFDGVASMEYDEIRSLFSKYKMDGKQILERGKTLDFLEIEKNDRYLISEMACKTFANIESPDGLVEKLEKSYLEAYRQGISKPTFRDLLDGKYLPSKREDQLSMFAAHDILDETVDSFEVIREKAFLLAERFLKAHEKALLNTDLYLSLVTDLDVYVATSMRTKEHFRDMANFCEKVFKNSRLNQYHLRYFDPTISASDSHEDKGLIECLMVKSARMLIYTSGDRDSFGKDVEAAMALCLGKPTIFYCTEEHERAAFFKDVHPLSRLVNFSSGVAGGAIVCKNEDEVVEIIYRLINNTMSYSLERKKKHKDYYLLKEKSTQSIVRIQTDNQKLSSSFWYNYMRRNKERHEG